MGCGLGHSALLQHCFATVHQGMSTVSGDTGCHHGGDVNSKASMEWVEAGEAAKCPAKHTTAPDTKHYPAQCNLSSALPVFPLACF